VRELQVLRHPHLEVQRTLRYSKESHAGFLIQVDCLVAHCVVTCRFKIFRCARESVDVVDAIAPD
jgi:hypothetical protein